MVLSACHVLHLTLARFRPVFSPGGSATIICRAGKGSRKPNGVRQRDGGQRQHEAVGDGPAATEQQLSTSAIDDGSDWVQFTPDPPGHRAGFVTIIGRPNAGKSTLMNAILGQQLSIVTERAQTTRKRILGILSETDYQACGGI